MSRPRIDSIRPPTDRHAHETYKTDNRIYIIPKTRQKKEAFRRHICNTKHHAQCLPH
jgi:hypothetical protein